MIVYVVKRQSQYQGSAGLRDEFWNKWKPEGQYCNWSAEYRKGLKDHTYRTDIDRPLKTATNRSLHGKNEASNHIDLVKEIQRLGKAFSCLICAEEKHLLDITNVPLHTEFWYTTYIKINKVATTNIIMTLKFKTQRNTKHIHTVCMVGGRGQED